MMKELTFTLSGGARVCARLLNSSFDGTQIPRRQPAVVVCPGGAYLFCSDREAEPVAACFSAAGFHTFILRYSVFPSLYPQPVLELAELMTLIREHADQWHLDADRIAICGFSAGGHLCASFSTLWNDPYLVEKGFDPETIRPNAAILSYPVIDLDSVPCMEEPVAAARAAILESDEEKAFLARAWDVSRSVSSTNPPTFLWLTGTDETVPPKNSLTMAQALTDAGVPCELHLFPKGPHGMALANVVTEGGRPEMSDALVSRWMGMAIAMLERTFR